MAAHSWCRHPLGAGRRRPVGLSGWFGCGAFAHLGPVRRAVSVATGNCRLAANGFQWRPLRTVVTADGDPGATFVTEPAARIGWALMGSTISVAVGVSVRVGARARSDPTIPADALRAV